MLDRYLWITEHYYPSQGGMAHSCDRIVNGLRELGLVIDVVHLARRCRRRSGGNETNGFDYCWALEETPAHGLNLLWNWLQANNRGYRKIIAFGANHALLAAYNYAHWLNVPLVTLVRGNDFDTAVFDFRLRGLLADAYGRSEQVLCVSHDKADRIKALFPTANVACVPNGIDLSRWRRTPSQDRRAEKVRQQFPSDKRVVGIFGELKAKKGVRFFMETLQISGLNDRIHVLLVGRIDPSLQQWLSNQQLSYQHVDFVGHHQLLHYYLACDCIAIPSFYDGMPNVLLEAAGLALPILAANVGGIRDTLTPDQALLFAPGDTHSLRKALHRLVCLDTQTLENMASAAFDHVSTSFTHIREAEAYRQRLSTAVALPDSHLQQ